MAKSYKKRASNFVKSSSRTAEKALPVINDSLKTTGIVVKNVAKETIPIVEKGVSAVYGTMATGFDLGVTGAKNVGKGIKQTISSRKHKRKSSRRKSSRGGKRTRRTRR